MVLVQRVFARCFVTILAAISRPTETWWETLCPLLPKLPSSEDSIQIRDAFNVINNTLSEPLKTSQFPRRVVSIAPQKTPAKFQQPAINKDNDSVEGIYQNNEREKKQANHWQKFWVISLDSR